MSSYYSIPALHDFWNSLLTINSKFEFNRVETTYLINPSSKTRYRRNEKLKKGETRKKVLKFDSIKEFMSRVISENAIGIQRGGIYPCLNYGDEVSLLRKNQHIQLYAPLVFDLDINDYEEERTCSCGKEKRICNQCWKNVMVPHVKELVDIVAQFGLTRYCIIFSGRRGVHIYYDIEKTHDLLVEQRQLIIDAIPFVVDADVTTKLYHLVKLPLSIHPSTGRICQPLSLDLMENFDVIKDPVHYRDVGSNRILRWIKEIKEAIF